MPQNTQVPRNLQGGPSFTYGDRTSRKRPADIDEIMHLVRTQGLTRETTEMRLTKKAPLPGIGQQQQQQHQVTIPSYSSRSAVLDDNENGMLDNIDNIETSEEAYEFDDELNNTDCKIETSRTLSPPHSNNLHNSLSLNLSNSNIHLSASQSNMLSSKSLESPQFSSRSPLKPLGTGQGVGQKRVQGRLDRSPSRNPRAVRNLPPMLKHERPIGQVRRPNAPSPSVTPPLPQSEVLEEDSEDFIET